MNNKKNKRKKKRARKRKRIKEKERKLEKDQREKRNILLEENPPVDRLLLKDCCTANPGFHVSAIRLRYHCQWLFE